MSRCPPFKLYSTKYCCTMKLYHLKVFFFIVVWAQKNDIFEFFVRGLIETTSKLVMTLISHNGYCEDGDEWVEHRCQTVNSGKNLRKVFIQWMDTCCIVPVFSLTFPVNEFFLDSEKLWNSENIKKNYTLFKGAHNYKNRKNSHVEF